MTWFLGSCMYDDKAHTRIVPKAMARGNSWVQDLDWTLYFPSEGCLFAPRRPNGYLKGELFLFLEGTRVINPKQDHVLLGETAPAEEIIDLRHEPLDTARLRLVEIGVRRSKSSERVVVALAGNRCVQVELGPGENEGLSVVNSDRLEALPVYELTSDAFLRSTVDGKHYVVPGETIGPQIGAFDWSYDFDFVKRVLLRIRKTATDQALGAGFPKSRQQIEALIATLRRTDLLPRDSEGLHATHERLKAFSSQVTKNLEELDDIVAAVAAMTGIRERLEEYESSLMASIEAELTTRVEVELKNRLAHRSGELDDRMRQLETRALEQEQSVKETQKSIVVLRAERANLASGIERMLESVRSAVAKNPATANVLISDLERALAGEQLDIDLSDPEAEPWNLSMPKPGAVEVDWQSFEETLATNAKLHGMEVADVAIIDRVARSGSIVLLPRDMAFDFVRCYAAVLSGGAFRLHPLDQSVIGLSDLWREAGSARPTIFARAWQRASAHRSRFQIVLLDAIDATPMSRWLPSFAKVLSTPDRPANLLVLMSAERRAIDEQAHISDPLPHFVPCAPRRTSDFPGIRIADAMGDVTDKWWSDASKQLAGAQFPHFDAAHPKEATIVSSRLMRTIADGEFALRAARALAGVREAGPDVAAIVGGFDWYNSLE